MRTFGVIEEDFSNYRLPAMFIPTVTCTFKCEKESGTKCCHNHPWINKKVLDISNEMLYNMFISNPITEAIVIGGLEPFDQFEELIDFVAYFRENNIDNYIVIYTGYYPNEVIPQINRLKNYKNIIIKFGRYVPNRPKRYDDVLGLELVSDNQFAEIIS